MKKNIFTIASDVPFLDALAEELWRESQGDLLAFSQNLILLPTRRACRHLHSIFLRHIGMKAALLPRMQPIGDIDEEEFYFSEENIDVEIPPAISGLRRQLLLTQLVSASDKSMPLDQAAQLAEALALFLDQVQREGCDFSNLENLVDKEWAQHWEKTLAFLKILTERWPEILKSEKTLDPADRRNRVLDAQAKAWRAKPPIYRVIAAGSTGTMPATRRLLDVISSLPTGAVILPGLDQGLDEEAWQDIGETHPQIAMKQLLKELDVKRSDVQLWLVRRGHSADRVKLLSEAMRPAEATASWCSLDSTKISKVAFKNFTRLNLDHPQEEAQVIALRIRQALEIAGKTVSLVTPDRDLAERVRAMLLRWGIQANDSGGKSLASLPIGAFLLDILAAIAPSATSVDYLSLLKHPYTACGLALAECRSLAREVEVKVWRSDCPEKSEWFDQIKQKFQPLTSSWAKHISLTERIKSHIDLALDLAASDVETGSARLWSDEAGEAAREWLSDWQAAATGFPAVTGEEYLCLFDALLRSKTVRPHKGQDNIINILGPLEARLIPADLIILGGLNEGCWPPETEIDPWMSRPMKKTFGLPVPEYRIGLAAHDFVQLASASEVLLTRSKRAGNAPTVASRFLLQLETVLTALNYTTEQRDALLPSEPWQDWARELDRPDRVVACDPPEPRPPQEVRPTSLRVTEIGIWRRNPYMIYAKRILGLDKLEALDVEIGASDRGILIHEALDQFIKKYPDKLTTLALDELLEIGKNVFASYENYPEVKAFWWPRFERIAHWFVEFEVTRRKEGIKPVKAEAKGQFTLDGFVLRGRADRIDKLKDGSFAIIDYKTGEVPSNPTIAAGYEPQLPLLALIASNGGFEDLAANQVSELAYWKLNGGRDIAEIKPIKGPVDELVQFTTLGLQALIKAFKDPATPYRAVPKPALQPKYDDYAHLARLAEWGRPEGEE